MTADYHREEVDCIMMLYPAMSKLNAVVPNRYLLVNVVAVSYTHLTLPTTSNV